MPRPAGQLQRVMTELTVGVHQGHRRRIRQLSDTHTGEVDQQVRVPFSGTVSANPGFVDKLVVWEQPFLYAPNQRRVPFPTPHFVGCKFELTDPPVNGTGDAVWVTLDGQVLTWTQSAELWYVGALVRFGAVAPAMTDAAVAFESIAHLTFQGYATYGEGEGDVLPPPVDGG